MDASVGGPTWVRGIEGVTCLAGIVNASVSLQGALFAEIRIGIHQGKVWQDGCDSLQKIVETFDLVAVVWR